MAKRLAPAVDTNGEITAEQIYDLYPRKVMRGAALRAIRAAMKRASPKLLLEMTRRFGEAWRGEKDLQYCPHGSTWFNGEGYNDDPSEWGPRRHYVRKDEPPLFIRKNAIEKAIQNHPANPQYIGYNRATVTDAQRAELKELRQKLAALEAEELRTI